MSAKGARKVFNTGGSRGFTFPSDTQTSEYVTVAHNGNIMIVDLTGEATKEDLSKILDVLVEEVDTWLLRRKLRRLTEEAQVTT